MILQGFLIATPVYYKIAAPSQQPIFRIVVDSKKQVQHRKD